MQNPYRRAFLLGSLGIKTDGAIFTESMIDAIDIHGTVQSNMWIEWFDAHRSKGKPKNSKFKTIFPGRKRKREPEYKTIEVPVMGGGTKKVRVSNWQGSSE